MGNQNILIVKIGGSTLGQHDTTLEDIVDLQKNGRKVVIIHGGGKIITEWLNRLGAATQFVQGERVTDQQGLEITTAVLSGVVNKNLVAAINNLGGKAAGVSGVDGLLLQGQIKSPELGYVGNVVKVNSDLIHVLLKAGLVPVISSVSFNNTKPSEGTPLLLNVNADTAAGEIAAALPSEKLIFLTDIIGVCDKSGKLIPRMNVKEAETAIASGIASGGMIPKIRAGIRSLESAREARIIDGRQAHALSKELESSESGTTIYK
jgi:acetylglutamate kinase